jgi:hypothetical protein
MRKSRVEPVEERRDLEDARAVLDEVLVDELAAALRRGDGRGLHETASWVDP